MERVLNSPEYLTIPKMTVEALNDFADNHHQHGHFIMACLENDFVEAVCRADIENLKAINAIAKYIWNELPSECWGSKEKVKSWLLKGVYYESK